MIPCSLVSRSSSQPILSAAVSLIWTNHRRIFSSSCHLSKWVSWRLSSSWISIRSSGTNFLFCVSKSIKLGCIGWLISVLCKSQYPEIFQRECLEQNLLWKDAQSLIQSWHLATQRVLRFYSEKWLCLILVLWYGSRKENQEEAAVPNFEVLIVFLRHYSFQGFMNFLQFCCLFFKQ